MAWKTDLAIESDFFLRGSGRDSSGIRFRSCEFGGIPVSEVRVLNESGEQTMGKPMGTYYNMDVDKKKLCTDVYFTAMTEALESILSRLVPREGKILAVGLGNHCVTSDSLGPETVKHIVAGSGKHSGITEILCFSPGVIGRTGMDSLEITASLVKQFRVSSVIVVDALAASDPRRICATIQITDTGIAAGSGMREQSNAFNAETLGVPVTAIGVPTVMDGRRFRSDEISRSVFQEMILTPKSIDYDIVSFGKVIGGGMNRLFYPELSSQQLKKSNSP